MSFAQIFKFLMVFSLSVTAAHAQSVGGSFDLNDKANIQFQVGPENSADETPQDVQNIIDLEKKTGDGIIQVYEVEGQPDLPVPEELSRQLQVDHVKIPLSVVQKFSRARQKIAKGWSEIYVKPTHYDRTLGVVFFGIRAATAASVFFSAPDIGPELATLMTVSVAVATGINNTFHQTLTNFFAYGIKARTSPLGKIYNKSIEYFRSLTYDVLMGDLINAVGGKNTLYQATLNGVFSNAVGSYFGADRSRLLREAGKRHWGFAYKLLLNPITFLIQSFDNSGQVKAITHVMGYEIRPTMLATIGIYLTLIAVNHFAKDRVLRILEKTYISSSRVIDWGTLKVREAVKNTCNFLLSGRMGSDDGEPGGDSII